MVKNTVVMLPAENINTETRPSGIGPGDRLQAARIEMGLTVDDVANRMHLSIAILESIEENNFEDITAPIFVKGYLRAYARIVSLDEEEMIRQYLSFYSDEDPPINSTSNTSPEISADDARIKWTTFIVIFVLCGLLAAWWWNNNQEPGETVSLAAEQSSAINNAKPADDSSATEAEIIVVTEPGSAANESNENQEVVESIAEVEPVDPQVEATNIESGISEEVAMQPELQAIPEPTVDASEEIAVVITENTNTVPVEAISNTAPTGTDQLVLKIHADTWADIKDANGHRLSYDLLRAERQLTLKGQAPFTVFFGNGHGVELMFNSEEVDVSSRIRDDNTARLKIGIN